MARTGPKGVLIFNLSISQGPSPEPRGKPRILAFDEDRSRTKGVFGPHSPLAMPLEIVSGG